MQWFAKWKCRPSAISRHQMSAKYKGWPSENEGQVQKVAKCYYDKFVFKMAKWINGQVQKVAKWKNDGIFILMAKWINGRMQKAAKCKNVKFVS